MRGFLFAAALRLAAPDESQTAAEAARAAFEAGDYDRVVELARDAYEATGELSFLYAQAHAERFRGNCDVALALYGRVLAANPTGEYAIFAQQGIRLCEQQLEAAPRQDPRAVGPTTQPPPPRVAEQPTTPANERPTADSPRPSGDVLGAVLLSTGAVAAVAGATLLVSADFARRRADAARDEATHIENLERTRALTISGAVVGSAGIALLVGATARYLTLRRTQASAALLPSDTGLVVTGRF